MTSRLGAAEKSTVLGELYRSARRKRALFEAIAFTPGLEHGMGPASPAQERLCILERSMRRNPAHVMRSAFELRGSLDQEALAAALSDLAVRHDLLRCRFVDSGGAVQLDVTAPDQAQVDFAVTVPSVNCRFLL